MRALTWHGARDVRVEKVRDPELVADDDIILRVTATAIGGTDLHLYRGKLAGMEPGDVLGHEFMGIVEEAGPAVERLRPGDRVVIPFVIACGSCHFCVRELYAACETTNSAPGTMLNKKNVRSGAGLFGHTRLYGGYAGGQAEYVRVPCANVGPLKIPSGLADEQVLFLSDILPAGYQAVADAGVRRGDSLAIFGAGPVGLMCAACARLKGVERIFMIDHHRYRLEFAARAYGVQPINFDQIVDPAEMIIEATDYRGVDASIDAIGFEAKGSVLETALTALKLEASSGKALRQAIASTRRGGTISVPGIYTGFIHGFLFGDAFDKGLAFRMGLTHVQRHMPRLLEQIQRGALHPEQIITHRLPLEEGATGYRLFDAKEQECRKVVLTPGTRP